MMDHHLTLSFVDSAAATVASSSNTGNDCSFYALSLCKRSRVTIYSCSSFTSCKAAESALISFSIGAVCPSSSTYITPWTLKDTLLDVTEDISLL